MRKIYYSLFFILFMSTTSWAQLTGERIVPSDNYPDLQTVADSLNLYGVGAGGVNFMLQGSTTFEEAPIEFTASGNADDPVYIGWDGEGEKPTVNFDGTESSEEAGFTLTGVDYYTFDGIKITNPNGNLEIAMMITNLDGETGSSYNTVKNVEITLDKFNTNQTVGILASVRVEPTELNGSINHNKFYNNDISNVQIGYSFSGGTRYTELMSVGNEVGTQDGGESIIHNILLAGLVTSDQNGFVFSNNIIRDLNQEGSSAPAAISTNDSNPYDSLTNDYIISNNIIEDLTSSGSSIFGMYLSARKLTYHINANKISNISATGGGTNTADGILVIGTAAIANIYNNMISGIAAPASAVVGNNVVTRGIAARTYGQINAYYNTVLLDYVATNPTNRSAAFSMFHNSSPVVMRNNIFINKTTLPADAEGTVAAFHKKNNTLIGIMEPTDNNIYYAGEPGPMNLIFYGFHASNPLTFETFADYQAAADSVDQNSYTEDVPFISSDNLHVLASANTVARNNALPIDEPIQITTDFDGDIRDSNTPDIGADEFSGISLGPLTGVRTVPSDDYPNLQTVADSIELHGVGSGGVSFMLQGGTTFEESPIEFTVGGNAEDPIYIGWDGEGEKPTVNFNGTESSEDAGFTLTGVDYYTFDGIKITNSSVNLEMAMVITNLDESTGSHNNTVKNMEIILSDQNENQTVGISVITSVSPAEFDGNNHNNKFYNNHISKVGIGYVFDGGTSTTGFMAVGNEVDIQESGESIIEDIELAGITIKDQNGFNLSNTIIRDLTQTGGSTPAGINTSSGNPSDDLTNDFIIAHNTIENLSSEQTSIFGMYIAARKVTYQIHHNKIHNVTASGGGGNTADGIMVLATGVDLNIYNNMVSGIAAPASALGNNAVTRGIQVRTYDQANIFYNTVVLDYTATNTAHQSAAISLFHNNNPVQMRNNIFINKTILPAESTGMVTAVYRKRADLAGMMDGTDNNIYYAGVPGPQNTILYGHHASAPLVLETLQQYKDSTATFDQNSYTEDVQFVDFNDLHILASANTVARNNALPVDEPIQITTDFDGTIRDTETPDIGADEIASAAPNVAINPNPADGETEVSLELSELSWDFLTGPEYTNPEIFMVYMSFTPDFEEATPFITIEWEEDVSNYSAPIEGLLSDTDYYWQIVPSTALENGETPEAVQVWTFTTELYTFPHPHAAENPTPEDGGVIELTDDHSITFGWDYNPQPNYTLPTYFEFYAATDTNSGNWDTPINLISYEEGQVSYEINVADYPNFTYETIVDNFWKVVPVSSDNETAAPQVPVWTFSFDDNTGLNELSIEGVSIYPNPADNVLNIDPGFEGKYEVMLYDVQGRLIKLFTENEGVRTLNISSVRTGAYQLVIRQGQSRFTSLLKVN